MMDKARVKALFGDRVVDKALTRIPGLQEFPRYVLEYLTGNYCSEENFEEDLKEVSRKMRENFAQASEAEVIKHRIKQRGQYSVISNLEVRLEETENRYWGSISSLNERYLNVDDSLVAKYEPLLHGGMWGTVTIAYDEAIVHNKKIRPFRVTQFTPFQVAWVRLEDYVEKRKGLATDEWLDLLINSIGLDPERLSRREKLLLLTRVVPLVESNVNAIEMAPRETGKTYLYRNISYYTHVLSGGKVSRAGLFINLGNGKIGLVGNRDAIVFDEVAKLNFTDPDEMVGALQGYMQDGKFGFGTRQEVAFASIALLGNLDVQGKLPHEKYYHLFEMLPEFLQEAALLDRLHAYIPGWEVPKLTPESYAKSLGFVSDYFSEVLHLLRRREVLGELTGRFQLCDLNSTAQGLSGRDERAIHKTLSGLAKIMYPDGAVSDDELEEMLLLCCELRQRVRDQLHAMASGEYDNVKIGVSVNGRAAVAPEMVERARVPVVRVPDEPRIGEVTGLAVWEGRGLLLDFEVIINRGTGRLIPLGSIQRVMRESIEAAYEYIRNQRSALGVPADFRKDYDICVGAHYMGLPKEGPSAGLTVLIGLLSALTRRPVKPAVAMTGEITVMGKVLGVGGIAAKLRAARDAGVRRVFLPEENARELEMLPPTVLEGLEITPVSNVAQAIEEALMPPVSTLSEAVKDEDTTAEG